MRSPLSPIIADIVLQDIENKALFKIGNRLVSLFSLWMTFFKSAQRTPLTIYLASLILITAELNLHVKSKKIDL